LLHTLDKIDIVETKNQDNEKRYNKSLVVIEKLEQENINMKEELELLREFKQHNKLQESKISNEYDGILQEYKLQIKRLQQELGKTDNRYEDCTQNNK